MTQHGSQSPVEKLYSLALSSSYLQWQQINQLGKDGNESSTSRAVEALGALELDVGARVPFQDQE
jgi:hypothetical protein